MHRSVNSALAITLMLALNACSQVNESQTSQVEPTPGPAILLPPTSTSPPTATPAGTATPVPLPSPTPTLTPTAGPSPTTTMIPLDENDPRSSLDLSVPDFLDNFSIRHRWGEFLFPEAASITIDAESLHAIDHYPDTFLWWSATDIQAANFYTSVATRFEDCAGKDSIGMAFRVHGTNNESAYTAEVACDGNLRIRRFPGDSPPVVLYDWQTHSDIHTGPGATNELGVSARGGLIQIFVNNTLLAELEDYNYFVGTFGLFVNSYETHDLSAFFDDFRYWYYRE